MNLFLLRPRLRRALHAEYPTAFLAPLLRACPSNTIEHRCARPALDRILKLTSELKAGRALNCSSAAERFGTSTKTIHRDMIFIRRQVGSRLAWNAERNSYELTGEFKFKNGGKP